MTLWETTLYFLIFHKYDTIDPLLFPSFLFVQDGIFPWLGRQYVICFLPLTTEWLPAFAFWMFPFLGRNWKYAK
jgi:hypothetical protein